MKLCMVAAMAVSLLSGSMAFAQEDDFDLDALLGDVGTVETVDAAADAAAPAAEAVEAPAAEAEAPADDA